MVQQQRCQLTIKPEYGYKHKDCQMKPPKNAMTDEPMHFDIKLLEFYSKEVVRVVGMNENIYKTIKQRSESWETPRAPYEVIIDGIMMPAKMLKTSLSGGASWPLQLHAAVFMIVECIIMLVPDCASSSHTASYMWLSFCQSTHLQTVHFAQWL